MSDAPVSALRNLPHLVIVESETGLRLVEFKHGEAELAHRTAEKICSEPGFSGRALVAVGIRQCSTFRCLSPRRKW